MDRLYGKEQIEEWASKRADDAGRLSRQLLDTMRENERLREGVSKYARHSKDCKFSMDEECSCGYINFVWPVVFGSQNKDRVDANS